MVAVLKSSLMLEGSGSSLEDVTEGARRATVETSSSASPPDPEAEPIARRRRFSGSEKRRLLAEADRCKANGQLGAFLRRVRSVVHAWNESCPSAHCLRSSISTTRTFMKSRLGNTQCAPRSSSQSPKHSNWTRTNCWIECSTGIGKSDKDPASPTC